MNVKLSILLLELIGVVLGCCTAKYLSDQLGLTNNHEMLFPDSKCVIEWARSSKQLRKFVNNRVAEINGYYIWINYVKSEDNPPLNMDNRPFIYIGLDYLGPLLINNEQRLIKNCVCLFTCLKIRAVYIELVEDMSTNSLLLCMRRFIARRGTPCLIISGR